ncbi:hypothetical protein FDECE_7138 [Fusarium decemcellulare]|nr:hypothetical protein FDECE_7138 [Fusarium decemcellulare]
MADPSRDEVPTQSELELVQTRAGAPRSRARCRASLACIPCRSKHVKCDGVLPSCTRCKLEEKACTWVKSRRGIRDPKKRDMMKNEPLTPDQDPETESTPSPNFSGFGILINVTKPLPPCYVDPETQNSRPHQYLFDLYYDNFHATHSWLPPKKSLSRLIEKIPGELNFLVTMILYVGSMYTDRVESTSLRADAYEMASGFLTPSVWSVQALLCMCVAAFGEQQDLCCSRWFDKTREMALSLGLHHKSFADEQEDPVLAESCRRAYWALYAHATTGLPCEEWEYETGNIPTPVTQAEYYRNGASQEYSSWAYLVDLTRICGRYILPLLNVWEQASPDAIEDANLLVESWILQLPVRKREFVDDNGAVDLILYHALGIAYG